MPLDDGLHRTKKFSWNQADPKLTRAVLLSAYEGLDYAADRTNLRGLSGAQLAAQAERVFGRPPKAAFFEMMTPVLVTHWLPDLRRDDLICIADLVASSISGSARAEVQTLSTKSGALAFLKGRNHTKNFQRHICKEFIRAHKETVERERRPNAPGTSLKATLRMVGEGAADARVPYAHTQLAWDGLTSLARGKAAESRSGLIVIPTGGGKTSTMVRWLLEQMGVHPELRVLWIANQKELVDQAAREFQLCGPQLPSGQERKVRIVHSQGHPISTLADSAIDVVCTTRQSLTGKTFDATAKKRFTTYLSSRPCVVVIDEAHHAVSPTYQRLVESLWASGPPVPMLVGLTATPFPSGAGMTALLKKTFVKRVVEVQTRTLILNGDLAQPVTHTFDTNEYVDLNDAERRQIKSHDVPDSVFRKLDRESRNRFVVQTWLDRQAEWGKTLVFACTVEHAQNLGHEFTKAGVATSVVHSQAEVDVGTELTSFRNATGPRVLVSVNMLLEGVDIPSARTAFLCRPTSSRVVMQQMIGRVLRGPTAGGDDVAHIVDLRDRWGSGVDLLSPVDLPDVPAKPAEDGDRRELRLPPVMADDGETEIGEDILDSIRRGMAQRIRGWGQIASLTPTRLTGYYDLVSSRIPVFEHTHDAWLELGEAQSRAVPSSATPMALFEDLAPPEPLDRDLRAFVDYCRSNRAAPPFTEMHSLIDVRAVARELVNLGAMTEVDKITLLRDRYEASLARSTYPSFQAFDEAVRSEVLAVTNAIPAGSTPEVIPQPDDSPREALRRAPNRELDYVMNRALDRGRALVAEEPDYLDLLADEWLPKVDWTRRPILSSWAYWSWRRTTRARNKPVIRINRALQAPKTQVPDDVLEYLVWHELCHHLLVGRGHDAEFRRLETLWPNHLHLDDELDTLHERFRVRVEKRR